MNGRKKISEHLLPKTRAYAEIWLDGEKLETTDEEPILGSNYLPRKFKTTVVIPPQNDVDVHANDLNFIAIADNGKLVGFNVLVGGGLAMTHGDTATYPRKADDFGFVPLKKTLEVAAAVVTTQRDWGNRSNRKNAKTKYTLDRVGSDVFKAEVEKRAGVQFEESRPYELTERGDRIGWVEGIDGKHHLALFIENGRLLDYPGKPLKTGVAEIAKVHQGDFRMTANQNLIVAGVPSEQKDHIEQIARAHGLIDDTHSEQRKNSMACVAFPTCPLAMAEAERFLPEFVTEIESVLKKNTICQKKTTLFSELLVVQMVVAERCWLKLVLLVKRQGVITSILVVIVVELEFLKCIRKTSLTVKSLLKLINLLVVGRPNVMKMKGLVTLRSVPVS